MLCGCTTTGNIVFWRQVGGSGAEAGWEALPPAKVAGVAKSCVWGGAVLAVNSSSATYILKEHNLCAAYCQGVSVILFFIHFKNCWWAEEFYSCNTWLYY